jgi:hypothetical protein
VANYNVDIEVGVKNLNAIKTLKRELEAIERALENARGAVIGEKVETRLQAQKRLLKEQAQFARELKAAEAGRRSELIRSYRLQRQEELRLKKIAEERKRLATFAAGLAPATTAPAGPDVRLRSYQESIKKAVAAETQIRNLVNSTNMSYDLRRQQTERIGRQRREQMNMVDRELSFEKRLNATLERRGKIIDNNGKIRNKNVSGGGPSLSKRANAALTAGSFPLLFGGGAFTALGGAAGGALTGQLFGGATVAFQVLGGAVDNFTAQTAQLGQALNPLTADLDALIKASGNVNSETSQLIQQLEEAGQTSAALTLATQEMAGAIGADGVDALRTFGEDTVELGNEFSRAMAIMGSAIAGLINDAGILRGIIGGLNQATLRAQVKEIVATQPGSAKAKRLKATFGTRTRNTDEITPKTLDVMRQINQEEEKRVGRNALILLQDENANSIQKQTLAIKKSGLKVSEREHLDANIRIARDEAGKAIAEENLKLANALAKGTANEAEKRKNRVAVEKIRLDLQEEEIDLQKNYSDAVAREVKQAEAQTRRGEAAAKRKAKQMQSAGEQQQKSLERAVALETRFAREVELREASTRFEKEKLRIEFQLEGKLNAIAKLDDQSLAAQSERNARRAAELQLVEAQRKEEERIVDLRVRSLQDQGVPLSMEFAGMFGAYQSGGMGNFDLSTGIADLARTEVALQAVLDKYPQIEQASQAMAETVTFGFRDIVDGAKSAEEVFADFLNGIADMLLRTAAQMIAQYIAIGIARQFAGLGAPYTPKFDGSSLFSSTPTSIQGVNPLQYGFPGLANGGTATAGRPYIVGERGPELFVPGQTGTVVPNHAMGGANVTVNVDASGTQAQGNQPNAKLLGQAIGAAVQAELIKQKRPGGLLAV